MTVHHGEADSVVEPTTTDAYVVNTWYHLTIQRDSGGYIKIYRDGVNTVTGTSANVDHTHSGDCHIGYRDPLGNINDHNLVGQLADLRILKGYADTTYLSENPSSAKDIESSNCVLALRPSSDTTTIKDAKGNIDFDTEVLSGLVPSTGVNSSTHNGTEWWQPPHADGYLSMNFNRSMKSYVSVPNHSDFTLGTDDFQIEFWAYLDSTPQHTLYLYKQAFGFSCYIDTANNKLTFQVTDDADNVYSQAFTNTSGYGGGTDGLFYKKWVHVAIVRDGGDMYMFVNGKYNASLITSSFSGFDSSTVIKTPTTAMQIGGDGTSNNSFHGYITSFRIVKGSLPYSGADFNVPTAPLTEVTNTKLLIQPHKDDSSTFVDVTGTHTLTAYNNAWPVRKEQHNTASPYDKTVDSCSLRFAADDGIQSIVGAANSSSAYDAHDLHDTKWRISFWIYFDRIPDGLSDSPNDDGVGICRIHFGNHGFTGWQIVLDKVTMQIKHRWSIYSSTDKNQGGWEKSITAPGTVKPKTWHFVEFTCDGTAWNSNVYASLDGTVSSAVARATSSKPNQTTGDQYSLEFNRTQRWRNEYFDSYATSSYPTEGCLFYIYEWEQDHTTGNTSNFSVRTSPREHNELKEPGKDAAGNGNFASTGTIVTTLDTPRNGENYNNLSVFDGLLSTYITYCGNRMTKTSTAIETTYGTWGANPLSATKYYWEVYLEDLDSIEQGVGVVEADKFDPAYAVGSTSTSWGLLVQTNASNGSLYHNGSANNNNIFSSAVAQGQIIQIALDAKNGKMWFGKSDTWIGDPAAGTGASFTNLNTDAHSFAPAVNNNNTAGGSGGVLFCNFGQDQTFGRKKTGYDTTQSEFYYAPPDGFVSMKSGNAEAEVAQPNKNFETKAYNGGDDGSGVGGDTTISGLQFQPGIIWTRPLDDVQSTNGSGYEGNYIFDSVIGFGSGGINVDGGNASGYMLPSMSYGIDSVNSNGFVVNGEETNYGYSDDYENITDPERYVAWCWKLGKTGSNWAGAGADPDTEHYSDDTGISVLRHDNEAGTIGSTLTLNHSLGRKPKFAIVWDADMSFHSAGHYVYHHELDDENYLKLNTDAAQSDWPAGSGDDDIAGDLPPFPTNPATSTTFKIGDAINIKTLHIYLFAEIIGFSKFGFIDGRGAAPNYVPMGFKPRFVMIKKMNGQNNWYIFDNERDSLETHASRWVKADAIDTETTAGTAAHFIDFVSNGLVLRNASNFDNNATGEYMYAAFADKPWTTSRGTGGA
jgi:hypothetical protein